MIKTKLKINLKGLNQAKLLTKLTSKGIVVLNLKKIAYNEMTFFIYSKDYKKFLENIDSTCYNINVEKKVGGLSFFAKHWHRFGIIIGLGFCLYLTMFFALSIWNIEFFVDGNTDKCVHEAGLILNEMGISVGTSKKQIDTRILERNLQTKMSSASIVIAEQIGPSLIITIKESTSPKENTSGNITAQYEGIIDSIRVGSGVVRVDIGDLVTKGQTLIESGKIGDVFAEANGEVVARIFIQGDAMGTLTTTKFIRSGKTFCSSALSIWNKNIGKEKTPDFEYCEYEQQDIYIAKNNLLPIKKTTTTYYELVEVVDILSIEELTEILKKQAYENAKNNFPPNEEELDIRYSIVNEGEYIRVVCTIETLTVISIKE